MDHLTTPARLQVVKATAAFQDAVHDTLKDLPLHAVLSAVEAHLKARPDAAAVPLETFSQRISRYAWELERNET